MKNKIKEAHKSIIETIINTIALSLTSYGVLNITQGEWKGYLAISFGMVLEFIKYYGRNKNYW